MLKKKATMFRIFVFVLIVASVVIYVQSVKISSQNQNSQEQKEMANKERKVTEELALENEKRLVEEIIRNKIISAKNFVKSISRETQIILLKVNGSYEVTHDRTPENNSYSEWLNNSDITIKLDYHTVFSINTKDIKFNITPEGSVEISYDERDINITAIDVSNVVPHSKVSMFGKKYTPVEVISLESIAKKEIQNISYNNDNILLSSENLKEFLNSISKSFGIDRIAITSRK